MSKSKVVGVLFCVACSVVGQTNQAAFFRISSPSNAVITDFDPIAGTISWSNDVAGVTNQLQRAYVLNGTSNWVDFVQLASTNGASTGIEHIINLAPPEDMALIPGGWFQMGDSFGEGESYELPVHNVYISAFYMDMLEVTKAQWDEVYNWALAHDYEFDNTGSGKAPDHPVHTVNWHDCVKWCNARSEREGRTPCYTVSSNIFRTGQSAPDCDWSVAGYRLPTEAEWEKAARSGLNGQRFPWGDTISHDLANYYSYWLIGAPFYSYDVSQVSGYHPAYNDGISPYTCPADTFWPSGYGLRGMAGNVTEWCWDWFDSAYYASSSSSNPHGASSGLDRVQRGGSWLVHARTCRSTHRNGSSPDTAIYYIGFRSVLPAN